MQTLFVLVQFRKWIFVTDAFDTRTRILIHLRLGQTRVDQSPRLQTSYRTHRNNRNQEVATVYKSLDMKDHSYSNQNSILDQII